jgi:hypothetical protein
MIFSEGCGSGDAILIPPDKDLLIHVTSPGFREWDESAGAGKAVRLRPGERLDLNARLRAL